MWGRGGGLAAGKVLRGIYLCAGSSKEGLVRERFNLENLILHVEGARRPATFRPMLCDGRGVGDEVR
jgi:hypothetical protein